MTKWIRRIKGAIGIGLTWAVGWVPVGALTGLGLWVMSSDRPGLARLIGASALLFGGLGFIGGSLFSAVLQLGDGRRRFDELTLPRFAIWGGLAGFLLPVIGGILGALAGVTAFGGPGVQLGDVVVSGMASLLGAGSAAGSLAIARKSGEESALNFNSPVRPPVSFDEIKADDHCENSSGTNV